MKEWIKKFMRSKEFYVYGLKKWPWPKDAWIVSLRYECSNIFWKENELSTRMGLRSILLSLRDRIDRDLKRLEN